MLNASQKRTNLADFSPASMFSVPAIACGWLATIPTVRPYPAEADHDVGREQRLGFQKVPVVDDVLDDGRHVVRLVGAVGDDRIQFAVFIGDLELDFALVNKLFGQVVVWQEADERAGVIQRVVFVAGEVVRHARDLVVGEGPAEFLHAHVLPGDGLDHIGAGHEHLGGLVDHDDEVGEGR